MIKDPYFIRFHLILFTFVFSIIILIFRANLVSSLWGWDGLGLSSFLLVIYYENTKSLNAGILTVVSNRVGDLIIIMAIGFIFSAGSWSFISVRWEVFKYDYFEFIILFLIAISTKRAQFPFRAWLPAAMAAPTPVSALVHSSTLVTAGIYLLYRHLEVINILRTDSWSTISILFNLTLIIGGTKSLWETDIKKVVALSTITQLRLIITAGSIGITSFIVIHLIVHAFFKAILFVAIGDLIHRRRSYQSFQKTGQLVFRSHLRATGTFVASLGLIGAPFIAAFYSKEPILENTIILGIPISSVLSVTIRLAITSYYRIRLIVLTLTNWSRSNPNSYNQERFWTSLSIFILFIPAFLRGRILPNLIDLDPIHYSLKSHFYDLIIQGLILIIVSTVTTLRDSYRLYTLYFLNMTFPNLFKNHTKNVHKHYFSKSPLFNMKFITPLTTKAFKEDILFLRILIRFNDQGLTKKFLSRIRTFKFNESIAFQLEWNTLYKLLASFLWLSLIWLVFI